MNKFTLKAIREEDVLPPTALLMLHGGFVTACGSNQCGAFSGDCDNNVCNTFTGTCTLNNCVIDKCGGTYVISQPCSTKTGCGAGSTQAKTDL